MRENQTSVWSNARQWHRVRTHTRERHVWSNARQWHRVRTHTRERHVWSNARQWHVLSAVPYVMIVRCTFDLHLKHPRTY